MHIVVCVKQVLEPEIPPTAFRVGEDGKTPAVVGVPASQVMDSYAENALETGIQLRDAVPGSRLTALCVGDEGSDEVLRRSLAFTANAAARAWDPGWQRLDGLGVAHILARATAALGGADVILCGRQASDIEEGVVGPALAEELGLACITVARRLSFQEGVVRVEREVDGLVETVEAPLPTVVTMTSSESNVPRMLKVKDIMLSRGKPMRVLNAAALGDDAGKVAGRVEIERLYLPETTGTCEMIAGSDGATQAAALVLRLRELRVM
ncbi:MAG: electron transfer flavoprotein subunit beta/FixA family protein [Gemmatimonadetes bacterium]|nr:electron transfer flavoprotein subunit beta/FixA family protein [Gemmatimonadota bacterium]